MLRIRLTTAWMVLLVILSGFLSTTASAQRSGQRAPQRPTPTPAPKSAPITNQDVIRLVQAKVGDDLIITKIKQSKTQFDLSTDGIVQLKTAGVSDRVLAVMMNPVETPANNPPAKPPANTTGNPPPTSPPAPKPTPAIVRSVPTPTPTPPRAVITHAPTNYGMYIEQNGQLLRIGQAQTKVQISKWRSLLKSAGVPLVRQKIDINIPGSRATSRFDTVRPAFYAFFPSSRDVSKFKLLQCKITGQNFNQRTVANASIFFSTEQNQDEVLCDIGPTDIKDLYRITPREDLSSGEFGFVEGNAGSKSVSNIDIIDVFDFGIDRKEDKLALTEYLNTLPPAAVADTSFQSWTKEQCQKVIDDREGKVDLGGAMLSWFKRQYTSFAVYWVDDQFARAFARLEMLDRSLTPEQASKLCALLQSADQSQYFVMVSIGQKVGSGRLIGANEGERTMRPFDSMLYNSKTKDAIVTARRLEPVGGYAGVWKVSFERMGVNGQVLNNSLDVIFEGRLNQNLDFKATFKADKISSKLAQVMQ